MPTKRQEKFPITFRLWPEAYRALKRLSAAGAVTHNNLINRIIIQLDRDTQRRIDDGGGDLDAYLDRRMSHAEYSIASTEYWVGQLAARANNTNGADAKPADEPAKVSEEA